MALQNYKPKHKKALWTTFGLGKTQIHRRTLKTRPAKPQARKTAIKRVSSAKAKRDRIYNARVKVWLKELGNTFCHCCIARNPVKRPNLATNCHHMFGRGWRNELLMVEKYWIPCCSTCHPNWIDANRELAREIGVLAPRGQWNNPPAYEDQISGANDCLIPPTVSTDAGK